MELRMRRLEGEDYYFALLALVVLLIDGPVMAILIRAMWRH